MKMRSLIQIALMLLFCQLLTACGDEAARTKQVDANQPGKGCTAMTKEKEVLQSTLAGTWYSADEAHLRAELAGYLAAVPDSSLKHVIAIIQPHAGYAYSGPTAAYGIKAVAKGDYDRVMVLAPTHRVNMPNRASVADVTHYATPLGEIPMDRATVGALLEYPFIDYVPMAHQGENSVEMQIPILQAQLEDFSLVTVVVGQLDEQATRQIAEALLQQVDEKTLLVVSGDFTHYGRRFDYLPFAVSEAPQKLKELDMGAFEEIRSKNMPGWYRYLAQTGATICGQYAIGVLLAMLPESATVELLHYTSSGELTGDWANSVSYVSAAVTGRWPERTGGPVGKENTMKAEQDEPALFTPEEEKALLKLARGTIEYYLKHGSKPSPEDLGVDITPAMNQVMGTFVTLHKNGQLRGCIGEILPRRELYRAVMDRALSAAFEDPRFPAVKTVEMDDIEVEISALTPPKSVASYEDIVIGRHGMILQKGFRSAVFLPQVAPEQGWGLEETLTHLSMKAGLRPDEWREGCSYEVFEATVFGE
jgi:hypothetical protein